MVNYFVSDGGNALSRLENFKPLCWVDMISPTDGEVESVSRATGVPEDMINAALDEEERARTEFDEGC